MNIKLRIKRWLCAHYDVESHTFLHGPPDCHVRTVTKCRDCGKGIVRGSSIYTHGALLKLLDAAKALPEGEVRQIN